MAKKIIFIFVLLTTTTKISAQINKDQLSIIREFATSMCNNPSYQGSNTSINAKAQIKSELNALLSKLTNTSLELGSNIKQENFQGMLQKDLLEATKIASECRLKIFTELKDRLITNSNAPQKSVPPSFDCKKASILVEDLICSSDELAILDLSMSNAYRDVIAAQHSIDMKNYWKAAQNIWLKENRNQCQSTPCLIRAYEERINFLTKIKKQSSN